MEIARDVAAGGTHANGVLILPMLSIAPIAVLVVLWGGFFNVVSTICGVLVCLVAAFLWLRKPRRLRRVPLVSSLFMGLALVYLASAVVNGATLTTLSEAGTWFAVAAYALLACALTTDQRHLCLSCVSWFGVATAVAGILTYVGVLPVTLGTVDDRLQFAFQYANAAAAWYGIVTLLCLLSPDRRLRSAVVLTATALLLTQSGGGLLAFVLVAIPVGMWWARSGDWGRLLHSLSVGFVAALLFVFLRMGMSNPAFAFMLVPAACACVMFYRYEPQITGHARGRVISLAIVAGLAVTLVAVPALLPQRASEALSTFVERLYQIRDGIALWASSPLLGVGPDNWQFRYAYIQTAQYHTTVVHSSYVQTLCDAGILGFGLLAAAVMVGLRSMMASHDDVWCLPRLAAAVYLLTHSFIDFDLQFSSLILLLVLLLANEDVPASEGTVSKTHINGLVAGLACLLACMPACWFAASYHTASLAMRSSVAAGDYATCIRLFETNSLAWDDPSAQEEYAAALYHQGALEEVLAAYEQEEWPTDQSVLYAALAAYDLSEYVQAGLVLVEHMESQPYNDEFFRNAGVLVGTYGLDASLVGRYNAAVDCANQLMAEGSPLLPKQQVLDTYVD